MRSRRKTTTCGEPWLAGWAGATPLMSAKRGPAAAEVRVVRRGPEPAAGSAGLHTGMRLGSERRRHPAPGRPHARRRAHYGQRWRRPPSAQLTKAMRDKLNGYRGNLMQARLLSAVWGAARAPALCLPSRGPLAITSQRAPAPPPAPLPSQAGESDKRLQEKLAAEAAAFAALDPEAAATQMPKMQARGRGGAGGFGSALAGPLRFHWCEQAVAAAPGKAGGLPAPWAPRHATQTAAAWHAMHTRLTRPPTKSHPPPLPHAQAPMLSVDNMEPAAAVATLRRALDGLNTLSSQRAALEEALKASQRGTLC